MSKNIAIIAEIKLAPGKRGESVRAFNTATGADITSDITYMTLSKAYKAGMWLENSTGKWRQIDPVDGKKMAKSTPEAKAVKAAKVEADNIMAFLNTCVEQRPDSIICQDLTWKFICRSAMRGRNILLTGLQVPVSRRLQWL